MNKYYYEFDEEAEAAELAMRWRVYRSEGKNLKNEDVSIEIAKCYEEADAQEIVEALNNMFLISQ